MALTTEQLSVAFALGLNRTEAEEALALGLSLAEAAMAKATGVAPEASRARSRSSGVSGARLLARRAMLAKMAAGTGVTDEARAELARLAEEGADA